MPMATLDAAAFPGILDEILSYATRPTLLAIRQTSHALKARADRLLCAHVVLALGHSADDAVGVSPFGLGPPRTWLPETVREHADAPASYDPPDPDRAGTIARAGIVDMTWSPDTFYYGYPSSFAPRHTLEDAIASGALARAHTARVYLPGWRDSFTNGQSLHIRASLPPTLIVFAPDGRGDLNALPTMRRVTLAVDGGIHRRIPHLRLERYEAGPDEYVVHLLAERSLPGRAKRTVAPDAREDVAMLFRDTLVGDFMLALDRWARYGAGRGIELGWGPDPENSDAPGIPGGGGGGGGGELFTPTEGVAWNASREARSERDLAGDDLEAFIHPALSRRPPRYTFVGGLAAITANFGLPPDASSDEIGRAIVRTMLRSSFAVNHWVPVPVILRLMRERVRFLTPEAYAREVGRTQMALETQLDPYTGPPALYLD